jgi:hypothetical protein
MQQMLAPAALTSPPLPVGRLGWSGDVEIGVAPSHRALRHFTCLQSPINVIMSGRPGTPGSGPVARLTGQSGAFPGLARCLATVGTER